MHIGFGAACPSLKATDDPFHVAVDNGYLLVESDARDGRRCVGSDSRQLEKFCGSTGQLSIPFGDELLCRPVRHARAPVIAEPAPKREDFVLMRLRQRTNGWKPLKEFAKALDHDGYTRLLQHDLRDPDGVWI